MVSPLRRLVIATTMGVVVSLLITVATLGVNPALAYAMAAPMFWAREIFCVTLSGVGLLAILRLTQPGRRLGSIAAAIALPVIIMWIVAALVLFVAAPQERMALIVGRTAVVCPLLITSIAVPLFVAFMLAIRGLAPTRLSLTGATGGFAAGAIAALVYTVHCPELAAPFLGLWYLLGMLIPACCGAWLGPRLLRW